MIDNNNEDDNNIIKPNIEMELSAEKRQTVREIIKEIKNFGVSQRQMVYLIYCLSLELENNEFMRDLVAVVGKHRSKVPVQISEQNIPKKKILLV
jgi:hypothetical protein